MFESGIIQLAIILSVATILAIVLRYFKQPIILAYLATGTFIGYYNLFHVADSETFGVFADLGIMFLLFLVGLEINYSSLRQIGKTSVIVGLAQIVFTFVIGFFITRIFDFNTLTGAYVAMALTFSSTIIIVKLLSEKRDLHSLYGKISIGFMLVQDFVAILLLVILAGIQNNGTVSIELLIMTILKATLLLIAMVFLGRTLLPIIFDKVAREKELLFLTSIAWVVLVASMSAKLGLSIEIGGFLAGIALANSAENFQISSQLRPLRDFFILIFFVILGSTLVTFSFNGLIWPIIIFSLFVLIGNPLIVLIVMSLMGFRYRTSFFAGVTVAQISEFSLILVALGAKLGHLSQDIIVLVTAVGVITITFSTYMIMYAEPISRRLAWLLSLFERRITKEEQLPDDDFNRSVVLVGANRVGESIVHQVPKNDLLIVDFDPEVIHKLYKKGYTTLLGDITYQDIMEKAGITNANLVISTSPFFDTNVKLLEYLKPHENSKQFVIVKADIEKDAELFYKMGAHYVIFPHLTAGHTLAHSITKYLNHSTFSEMKKNDLKFIRSRLRKS